MTKTRPVRWSILSLCVATCLTMWQGISPGPTEASCGAATCFLVIGSQQQVPLKGLLTVNGIYNYTPSEAPPGQGGSIPFINVQTKQLVLSSLPTAQISTLVQTYTLDFNYGVTDRFGVELTLPYKRLKSETNLGLGSASQFSDNGIGDITVTAKYNVLPTLRSMMVAGLGVVIPTGDYKQTGQGNQVAEPTVQLGKGAVGLIPSVYATYEVLPHRLNAFGFANYRHTFRNSWGYQFGDEYTLNAGINLVTVPWLVITQQLNYRYMVHDSFDSALYLFSTTLKRTILLDPRITDRPVPTTGSTFLAYSPGVLFNVNNWFQAYFFAQIPLARDFNGNIEQQTSYVGGITKYFQTPSLF
jgi:hypothetical protein